jgi:hypothetical protein
MPQTRSSALYGHPDGSDFEFLVTNAILAVLFEAFKLLISAIITNVRR